uniref:Secreted protein n=1 Tax=Panagrellus redivivus TaxID=6233 RepID=A0A7E4VW21_PANRE
MARDPSIEIPCVVSWRMFVETSRVAHTAAGKAKPDGWLARLPRFTNHHPLPPGVRRSMYQHRPPAAVLLVSPLVATTAKRLERRPFPVHPSV